MLHPYTFRAENTFLPTNLQVGTDPTAYGKAFDEQLAFMRAGIDGFFTDQADIGVLSANYSRAGDPGTACDSRGRPGTRPAAGHHARIDLGR